MFVRMQRAHVAKGALIAVSFALFSLLVGCRSVVSVPEGDTEASASSASLRQQLVIIVHGDANYLYHGDEGAPHRADEETLREAFAAARSMPRTELFVVHQRPADSFLGLVPRDDGTLYHFRRGRLLHQTTYEQDRSAPLATEAQWIQRHRAAVDSSARTAVLYYGHAIPEQSRPGYHRSRPGLAFGIDGLVRGLSPLAGPGDSMLDAVVLSTCDGGTPHTVAALSGHARHLLAAPNDLHLSFIDADLLASLAPESETATWMRRLAAGAFERLSERTVTAVGLATYDLDRAGPIARRLARQVPSDTTAAPSGGRTLDCRRVLGTAVDTMGVRTWYRPARFGPRADRESHSGWGCLPASSRNQDDP